MYQVNTVQTFWIALCLRLQMNSCFAGAVDGLGTLCVSAGQCISTSEKLNHRIH